MYKKVMVLVTAAVMLLAMVMPTSAATTNFTDLAGKDCEQEVAILAALGVVEGINEAQYAPERGVTRAEMATILVRLMGAEGTDVTGDIFTDVTLDHWAYSNISIAYKAGLVVGMGDGTFLPDEHVTHVQLVKMLLCAMGYDVQAEAQGGYPSGYYAKAAQLGMLKGITAEMNKAASRGNMAIILYNTINLPLFDRATYGEGADGSYIESDDTLLSRYMDIYVEEGVVSANYYTAITTPERACEQDEIAIGSSVYKAGETNSADYLGMKVKVYYSGTKTTDADVPEILIAEPANVVAAYKFSSNEITDDTTKTKLFYEKEGKEGTISIENDATIIYNGQVKEEGYTVNDIKPRTGTVTLICNNGTSADVVSVWSYTNYVAQSADVSRKTVHFRDAVNGVSSLVIDPDDKSVKSEFVNTDGTAFDITGVSKWNILSVAKSADGKVLRVINSNASVLGKITETSSDTVSIDGTEYTVAAGVLQPALNTAAKFYLDFMGNITAIDTNAISDYMYGYLVNTAYSKGVDKKAQIKIFTQDGEMVVYDTADTVRVNDSFISNTRLCENIPPVYKYTGAGTTYTKTDVTTIRQLVKYTVNAEGKINEILTAMNKTNAVNEVAGISGFNMVLELNAAGQAYYPRGVEGEVGYFDMQKTVKSTDTGEVHYVNDLGLLGANLAVDTAKTVIFRIPAEDAADEDYQVITAVELPHRVKLAYTTAYDLTDGYALGAIVYDAGASGAASVTGDPKYYSDMNVPAGLIISVSKMMNDDLESYYKLKLIDWSGNAQDVYVDENLKCAAKRANTNLEREQAIKTTEGTQIPYLAPSDLRAGDIIRFEKNTENYLTVADVVYRAETPGMKEYAVRPAGNEIWATTENSIYVTGDLVSSGTIQYADGNAVIVETSLVDASTLVPTQTVTRTYPFKSSRIILFEKDTQTYKAITSDDIVIGDHCVVLWRTITPMAIFIIR